jgi:tRNA G18 (ribose-2'-O)-methylase SpoU
MSGFFEIGIYHTKTEQNVGTLWRSAYQLGAAGIFTIGKRYSKQASDTMKSWRNIPLRNYVDFVDFNAHRPLESILVGIEFGGHQLSNYVHPKKCIYLLGAEDSGLPTEILSKCDQVISIESLTQPSYNVAVAGSIVMYHRFMCEVGNQCRN